MSVIMNIKNRVGDPRANGDFYLWDELDSGTLREELEQRLFIRQKYSFDEQVAQAVWRSAHHFTGMKASTSMFDGPWIQGHLARQHVVYNVVRMVYMFSIRCNGVTKYAEKAKETMI
jgi:hypothetical protein